MGFRFDAFEADAAQFRLTRDGETVGIEPKPLRLLIHLLSRHPATCSSEELVQALWAAEQVTPHSLTRAVRGVRRALGESAKSPRVICNVRGRGYRIGVDVERIPDDESAPAVGDRDVFVGREAILAELREAFERARAGRGDVALLTGEPGIGKTRTAEILAEYARAQGAEVVWGRTLEAAGAPALWPWLQALRSLVRGRDAATLRGELGPAVAELAALVPEVRERLPRLEAPSRLPPGQARFRFLDAVAQWLVRASAERTLVLVFDDLHWADPMSLELFGFAASEVRDARVLLLGTFRHVAAPPNEALDDLLAILARLPGARPPIRLTGLGLEEVERLIALSADVEAGSRWARRIYERSDGNPFFVRELLRLGDSGAGASRVTSSVRAVVSKRLGTLAKPVHELLEMASVLGRTAPAALLEQALGASSSDVWGWLEEAERAGFVEEVPDGGTPVFRFVHAVLQETVYAGISHRRRMPLHRRVGEALEALHAGDPEPHVPALAHHFGEAAPLGDRERAADYAARAARQARARFAFEEAARSSARALELLGGDGEPSQRCDLLLDLGEARILAGQSSEGLEAFRRAAALARSHADVPRLARAALGFGGAVEEVMFANPEALGLLEEALALLPEEPSPLRIRLLGTLAPLLLTIGVEQDRRALALAEEIVGDARRLGDAETLADALARRTLILQQRPLDQSAEERMRGAEEALDAAHAAGRQDLVLEARRQRIALALELGQAELLDTEIHRFARESDRIRIRAQRHHAASYLAMRALLTGRFQEARTWIDGAETLADPADMRAAVLTPLTQRVLLPVDAEGSREVERAFRDLIERFPFLPQWRTGLVLHLYEAGRDQEAGEVLDGILADEVVQAIGPNVGWLLGVAAVAHVCAGLGRREAARRLYDLLEPYAPYNIVIGFGIACLGPVSLYLGELATTFGRAAEAEAHLAAALEGAERMGARPWEAHAHLARARLRLFEGDLDAARRETETTAAIAGSLGMDVLRARAEHLID